MHISTQVIKEDAHGGQTCELREKVQSVPCEAVPCYTWKLAEWSECEVAENMCGSGTQRRLLKCVQEGNMRGL